MGSLGLQEMQDERGQKQWECDKRNIRKTFISVLLGLIIRQQVLQVLSKRSFWWQEQGQGRAEVQLGVLQSQECSSEPGLLPGLPAVTLQQLWPAQAGGDTGQHRAFVPAEEPAE